MLKPPHRRASWNAAFTSFATALSLVGLLVYGVGTIFDFAFAMLLGIVSGTYSTWFIAAPTVSA